MNDLKVSVIQMQKDFSLDKVEPTESPIGVRSWSETVRLIRELRPCIAVVEVLSQYSLGGLDQVLSMLTELGYETIWRTLASKDDKNQKKLFLVLFPSSESQDEAKGA